MSFDPEAAAGELRGLLAGPVPSVKQIAERLEQYPVAVLVSDDGGHFIGANGHAVGLTGFSRAELAERSVAELTPADEQGVHDRLWSSFARSVRQHGRYDICRKDGSRLTVRYDAFRDLAPGIHVSFLRAEPHR